MNDFAPEPLHDALADLAETVRPVDLRDRALRASRRLAIRRAVTVAAAVVALIGVSAAGVSQVLPKHTGLPQQPATSSSATPSPEPSTTPSVTPTPDTSSAPTGASTSQATSFGRLYYVDRPDSTNPSPVTSWLVGVALPESAFATLPAETAYLNANVSPDGRQLSYVTQDGGLHLVDLRTGRDRMIRGNVDGLCNEPVWAPDNRRLIIGDTSNRPANGPSSRPGVLDVYTDTFTPFPEQVTGCHFAWSSDDTAIAYADGAGKIFVANADGSGRRAVPGLGDGKPPYGFDLESVSGQGRRIALRWNDGSMPAGDAARNLYSNAVIDTRTGQKVKLPVTTGLLQVVFRPDGGMLLRVKGDQHNQLLLVAADGTELDRRDEPAGLKNLTLLTR
ncbi:TolB family protein [Planosporangium mesophilum]|uniref:WD40 repeat protein n=1 Tax=Planosporangium mesophilum TaxID=689768 RepID=A0A8J3T9J9_9ACTN|nr:hypothetical protein [Planosporangium mesophilum]NJC82190.1 hypothetical protein [Planosporangium mesophilum]GII22239.1 hypothetical protein Pme01_18360 [Planosporangium mesophilum]